MILLFFLQASFASFDPVFQTKEADADYQQFVKQLTVMKDRDPIILIPGVVASKLEYKKKSESDKSYKTLWMDSPRMIPGFINSYIKDLVVDYDPVSDAYSSNSAYDIRPIGFGTTDGIKCIDALLCSKTIAFKKLIETLEAVGYKNKVDLFGAPYDFRLASSRAVMTNGMFNNFRMLIEHAYQMNGNKKVHLISHSAGGPFTRHFLVNFVSQQWKDTYVASFIAANAPFGGAPIAMEHSMCTTKWILPTFSGDQTYALASTMAQVHWLIPDARVYDPSTQFVEVRNKNTIRHRFTAANLSQIWSLTNRSGIATTVEKGRQAVDESAPPRVNVHVYYSSGFQTPFSYVFDTDKAEWWKTEPTVLYVDGDGAVPVSTLAYPKVWASKQTQSVEVHQYPGKDHTEIFTDPTFVKDLLQIVARD